MSDITKSKNGSTINKEKILIVEGKDEQNFLKALFEKNPQLENIQIFPIGGKDQLGNNIKVLIKAVREVDGKSGTTMGDNEQIKALGWDDVKSVGIIRDADEDPKGAFNSVVQVLKNNSLPTPKSSGTFSEPPSKTGKKISKKIGIFIMPDGKSKGAIESLCLSTVEEDEKNLGMIKCIDEFMKCNERLNTKYKKPKDKQKDKARCRAFLSLMEEDTRSLGEAALKDYWNWESARFEPLIEFLEKL